MIIWVFFRWVFTESFLLAVISASNSWPGFLSWISSNSTWQHYTATAYLCLNLLSCWTRFQSIDFIGPLGGFWWTRSSFWICKTQCYDLSQHYVHLKISHMCWSSWWYCRSSRLEVFCEKSVPKNFLKIYRKTPALDLFFNKVGGSRLWHRCFPVNFEKSLRTLFFQNTSGGCFCKYKIPNRIVS